MAVVVQIGGIQATIDGYEWTSDDRQLTAILNALLLSAGPSGNDPHPDLTAAQAAVDALGGEIVQADDVPFDPDVVY